MAVAARSLPAGSPRGQLLTGPDSLQAAAAALAGLAVAAADANPFLEPGFLLLTLQWLQPAGFTAFLAGEPDGPGAPLGLFPFVRARHACGLDALTSFAHPRSPHGYLATPLVRAGREAEAVDALLDALDAGALEAPLIELEQVAADSVFHARLLERLAARGQPWLDLGRRDRAVFRPRADAEAYLAAAQGRDRRRKLAQLRRQLERHGPLSCRRLEGGEDPAPWIEAFLALEEAGWKGRQGTAMASTAAGAAFFRSLLQTLHAEGRLVMYGLWLGQRPVALHCALLAACDRGSAFAFKIAYDEAFARQSPGVQLELWAIGELHGERPMARFIDSCAGAQQQLWNELWLDRRELAHLIIGPRGARGRALIAGLRLGRGLKGRLTRLADRRHG